MSQEIKQIPKSFPALYVYVWDKSGKASESAKFSQPTRTTVEVSGEGGVVTLKGSLDGETWVPIKSKEGDAYRFASPGLYPIDTSILQVYPVIAEGFQGTVKVMAI